MLHMILQDIILAFLFLKDGLAPWCAQQFFHSIKKLVAEKIEFKTLMND
eukprot:UN00560